MRLAAGQPHDAGISPEHVALARRRAKSWVDDGITPSLVVLAARRGTIVIHDAFGRFGPAADARPLEVSAIFPLASISKVICATAILVLVDDGVLGLNRPVQEYLPEFVGENKDSVMVHHLLTHTSGLVDKDVVAHQERVKADKKIPPPEPNEHPDFHEATWLRFDAPLTHKPGERMSYSGAGGYTMLSEIIRRLSGKNLADFARERIFAPLGMHDTSYRLPSELRSRYVERADDLADKLPDPTIGDRPSGSVGGYSTAMDMAIFCQMFLNGGSYGDRRVLSRAAVREMTRNQTPGIPSLFKEDFSPESSRGYGWDIKGDKKPRYHGSLESPMAFTHQGAGGVSILGDPSDDLVVVFLSVSRGVMSPDYYHPQWTMDLFTNMMVAAIVD